MTNATLVVEFETNTYEFDLTWENDGYFFEGEELAERIFFSDEFIEDFKDGAPDMTVYLKSDVAIKSRVNFEAEASDIFPTKKLSKLLEKKNAQPFSV
jgi:hypothetical protein